MCSFTAKRNLQLIEQEGTGGSECQEAEEDRLFQKLISEIDLDLHNGRAFLLSDLTARFNTLLPSREEPYKAFHLQGRLERHFKKNIQVIKQHGQGKSNIIIKSDISLEEAITAAVNSAADRKLDQQMDKPSDTYDDDDFHLIKTVEMLHAELDKLKKSSGKEEPKYASPGDIGLDSLKEIPDKLKLLVTWLLDKDAFSSRCTQAREKNSNRILSLCESIIYCGTDGMVSPPGHLGLAAEFHHLYGKRNIIDTLNSMGYCIPYVELRRFLTATATSILDGGAPHEIIPLCEGGGLIQEGADNVDINCETISGKDTFHSMARVLFQQQDPTQVKPPSPILKGKESCLPVTDETMQLVSCLPCPRQVYHVPPPRRLVNQDFFQSLNKNWLLSVKDLAWTTLRSESRCGESEQAVPFWSGYGSLSNTARFSKFTRTSYPPIIEAKPSDPDTVYTTMFRGKELCENYGQPCAIQTMDQQLYCVAQQVKWACPETFQQHVLRLGGFHTLCTFISTIGSIWGDAGLSHILVESGVYAAATAHQMLSGKQFHRAVRGLTLAYEALMHLLLEVYLEAHPLPSLARDLVHSSIQKCSQAKSDTTGDIAKDLCEAEEKIFGHLEESFLSFVDEKSNQSCTFKFWINFLEAVSIMLNNIRAERSGNWELHLQSTAAMLPYMFGTNKCNYARWLPVYLLDMKELPQFVEDAFCDGQFTFLEKVGNFNGIWSDMGTEKTVIRDSKSSSGVIGLTRKLPALLRWTLTRQTIGQYSEAMKERCGLERENETYHHQVSHASMKEDELHVSQMIAHIKDSMTNPFHIDQHPEVIVNIGSGLHATLDVSECLNNLVKNGEHQATDFINSTLSMMGNGDFFNPIKRNKLLTFTDLLKPSRVKKGSSTIKIKMGTEMVFRRALAIAQSRMIDLSTILKYPLTSVPPALFHDDGQFRKTQKSDLLHILEEDVSSPTVLPQGAPAQTCVIRDAMGFIQSMKGNRFNTFESLAAAYFQKLKSSFAIGHTVMEVFDTYIHNSIKDSERLRRQGTTVKETYKYNIHPAQTVPDWNKFLHSSENKKELIRYLSKYIVKAHKTGLDDGQLLYVAGGLVAEQTETFNKHSHEICEALTSDHEEADTRIVLHAYHFNEMCKSKGISGRVIVQSQDTDVAVILMHHFPKMKHVSAIYMELTPKGRKRYLPIHELCSIHGLALTNILPAIHSLTGCDTTSSFFGIGKKKVIKSIKKLGPQAFQALDDMGTEEGCSAAQKLTLALYHKQSISETLTELRIELAKEHIPLSRIPPSISALEQHILRASLQAKIWQDANKAMIVPPEPEDFGWQKTATGTLTPTMITGTTAADILDGLICQCKGKNKCENDCSCVLSNIPCTVLCGCMMHCSNTTEDEEV